MNLSLAPLTHSLNRRLARRPPLSVTKLGAVVAALLVLALAVRLPDLGRRSFWLDELSSVGTAALSASDLSHALTVDRNMGLYYWLLFGWLRLVGTDSSEALIRLPSALAGAAAPPLLFLVGQRLWGTPTGLCAASLLAFHGYHIAMSQEARSYALWATLAILSYVALDEATRRGGATRWLFHGAVNALAISAHYFALFFVLAQMCFVILTRRSCDPLRWPLASALITLVASLHLIVGIFSGYGSGVVARLDPPTAGDLLDLFTMLGGGHAGVAVAYLGLALAGGMSRYGAHRSKLLALSWLCLPILLVLGISLARPIYNDRYLFTAVPAVALLAGVTLSRLPLAVTGTALIALAGFALQADVEARRIEQWRQAAAYVGARALPDDGYIFLNRRGQNGFEYYAGWQWGKRFGAPYEHIIEPLDWRSVTLPGELRRPPSRSALEAFAGRHQRIWLVLSHEHSDAEGDLSAAVREALSGRGYSAVPRQFRAVRVLLYERR